MIRLAYWLIASLLVTAGIAWLISLPGTLTIELLDYRLQPRLGIAAILAVAAVVAIILVWGIVKRIIAAPYYLARRSREKRKDQGYLALSDGFIALQAGDAHRARQLAREAQSNLPRNAAAQLLEARADLAVGDMHSAREHYRALITNRKTALAALSGLYDQARQQGRVDAALTFAQKAIDLGLFLQAGVVPVDRTQHAQAGFAAQAFDQVVAVGQRNQAILGDGDAPKGLVVKVERVSASAREKLEAAGGKVETSGGEAEKAS